MDTLSKHDLFVFPSLSENFGHVIFESLSAGTPVITSVHTPWKTNDSKSLVSLPLDDPQVWAEYIADFYIISPLMRSSRRHAANLYSHEFYN